MRERREQLSRSHSQQQAADDDSGDKKLIVDLEADAAGVAAVEEGAGRGASSSPSEVKKEVPDPSEKAAGETVSKNPSPSPSPPSLSEALTSQTPDPAVLERLRNMSHLSTITEQNSPYSTNPGSRRNSKPHVYPTAEGVFANKSPQTASRVLKQKLEPPPPAPAPMPPKAESVTESHAYYPLGSEGSSQPDAPTPRDGLGIPDAEKYAHRVCIYYIIF